MTSAIASGLAELTTGPAGKPVTRACHTTGSVGRRCGPLLIRTSISRIPPRQDGIPTSRVDNPATPRIASFERFDGSPAREANAMTRMTNRPDTATTTVIARLRGEGLAFTSGTQIATPAGYHR